MTYELGIITQFRNEAIYFAEWITYHRLVGVEHFWLYDDGSIDAWQSVLAPYLAEGVVEVLPLPEHHASGVPTAVKQPGTFRDGLRRARGKARWVALIDADEFLLPMRELTVPDCLERHFPEASGVFVNWRMFGTNHQVVPAGAPLLPSLTACSLSSHPENAIGKSLVRPEQVAIERVWSPHHFPLQDILVLADGTIVVGYTTNNGTAQIIRRYAANGTIPNVVQNPLCRVGWR